MKCPICGNNFDRSDAALSRKDNKTLICSACGMTEAFNDFFRAKADNEKSDKK